MARRLPPPPPSVKVDALCAEVEQRRNESELDLRIVCRLVTPLFGGGHTAGENDLVSPISPKGIRGQLRHWWRLVSGPSLASSAGLSADELVWLREIEIFGSTALPSPFDVGVRTRSSLPPSSRKLADPAGPYQFARYGPEAYALFSAIQNGVPDVLKEGFEFELRIRWQDESAFARRTTTESRRRRKENEWRRDAGHSAWPDPWNDLTEIKRHLAVAMWAWLNFGGMGVSP